MRKTLFYALVFLVLVAAWFFFASWSCAEGFVYFKKKAAAAGDSSFVCDNTYLICDAFTGTDGAQYDNSYWDNNNNYGRTGSYMQIDNNQLKVHYASSRAGIAWMELVSKTSLTPAATMSWEIKTSGTPRSGSGANEDTTLNLQDSGGRYAVFSKVWNNGVSKIQLRMASSGSLNVGLMDDEDDGPHVYKVAFKTDTNHVDVYRDGVKIGDNLNLGTLSWGSDAKLYVGTSTYWNDGTFTDYYHDYVWLRDN